MALQPQLFEVWHGIDAVQRIADLIKTIQTKLQQCPGRLGEFLKQQGEFINERWHQHRHQHGEKESKSAQAGQQCHGPTHREAPLQCIHQAAKGKRQHDGGKQQQQPLTQVPQDEACSNQCCKGQCLGKAQASALASPSV